MYVAVPCLAVLTAAWWAVAIAGPAWLANRALARGRKALAANCYDQAERWFKQVVARPDLKSAALCLIAQSALRAGRPQDAIFALDELGETSPCDIPASPHPKFLRALACLALRQGRAAERALANVATEQSGESARSSEDLLALLHAALVSADLSAAEAILDRIAPGDFAGPLAARLQICRAAFHWARSEYPAALGALPEDSACSAADQSLVAALRKTLQETKACP